MQLTLFIQDTVARIHYSSTLSVTTGNNIPEPGSIALLGLGMIGLGLARRRRQS
ncbi:MAG: PEP-CTERM sorting domain-containing protein [Dechloromonas sp.]|nr:MAG: PEP-CTERM sorting domain-containing protein [Dechloromonas sp.]